MSDYEQLVRERDQIKAQRDDLSLRLDASEKEAAELKIALGRHPAPFPGHYAAVMKEHRQIQVQLAELQKRYEEYAGHCFACTPYLKEGETPAECIARNRADASMMVGELAKERCRSEVAESRLGNLEEQNRYLRAWIRELRDPQTESGDVDLYSLLIERIEPLAKADPAADTADGVRLRALVELCEAYEKRQGERSYGNSPDAVERNET